MTRTAFALAVAGLMLAAGSAVSQAAPGTQLPAGAVSEADSGSVTLAYCGWHCHHWHHWHHWCRWHRC